MRKLWEWLGHALTLKDIIILLAAIPISGLGLWFATANQLFRLLAPWSYLIVVLITFILACVALNVVVTVYQRLTGWKPTPQAHVRRLPPRDAPMTNVVDYIRHESAFGRLMQTESLAAQTAAMNRAIVDAVTERQMTVWARDGLGHVERISTAQWKNVVVRSDTNSIEIVPSHPLGEVAVRTEVYFSWKEVRKAWPKPALWHKIARRSD